MKPPTAFDVFTCSLDGINLIEASAGTGKTWNICGLYLRLLLERGLEVKQILVVTFTNAATAELRARIRSRIVDTLAWLRDADASISLGDPFVRDLVCAVERATGATRDQLALTLDQALNYFDEAAIFTIHGFCQRALAEAAFSAGLPFSLALVTDDSEMTLEAVHDFWRRRVADASCPSALAAYLQQVKDTPEKYAQVLSRSLRKPLARCLWPADIDRTGAIDAAPLATAYDTARNTWMAHRDAIVAAVVGALPALNANSYNPASVGQSTGDWDAWFSADAALAALPREHKLLLLSSANLALRTKQRQTTPVHVFFDQANGLLAACATVEGQLALARLRLIRDLIETVGPELRRRKRERRVIAFEDMLYNLHAALEGGEHPELAASLREKFPVALIDEFQDTDPLQFSIFDRIYRAGSAPAFLVGDPKQAIYSFRNADLHAYLAARKSATREFTLADNQRSTRGLIEAVNGLFATTANAFMLPGLDYHPVAMGDRKRQVFRDQTLPRPDLQVWMLPADPDDGPIFKQSAFAAAAEATAAEIARLIAEGKAGRIAIDRRALAPGDIAVLVRTHAQGSALKHELAGLGVGSVELAQASVFRSADAEEVERVLIAINQPSRDALLRGALATEMMGYDAGAIAAISGDESALLRHLERFAGYRDLWQRHGVGIMYRRLLTEQQVSARMLCRPDGERRLTNLLHLGEQIHQAASTHESPDALLRWLAAQRRESAADDVAQLRLESDRNLVQIVTIHKAKGLEFPIVFCPFAWDGLVRKDGKAADARVYHDDAGAAVIDFRLDDEIGTGRTAIDARMKLEAAAESLRLTYVALTRAIHRCYLVAGTYRTRHGRNGSVAESSKSLLNWLVAGGADTPAQWLDGGKPPAEVAAAWQALAAKAAPHLDLAPLPAGRGRPVVREHLAPESLSALPPPLSIAPAWRFSSFSGLAGDSRNEAGASDHDARVAEVAKRIAAPPPAIAPDDILRFPRGPSAGDCLHAIFERIDFTHPAGWNDAIARALLAHPQYLPGVRAPEQSPLLAGMAARMLAAVLSTRLTDGIVLGAVPSQRRLTELEFSLPSRRVSAHALNAALRKLGYDVPRLTFRDLEGYLKGYIDLVFEHDGRYYVLDWKSNHLGYAPSDYGPAQLKTAMTGHSYHLQYLLYALAVERYLKHRVPDYTHATHFGGVLYLFVRGVRPDWSNADGTPAGVFHDRPSAATLARLDALFGQSSATVTP